jgi:hypothetical protein
MKPRFYEIFRNKVLLEVEITKVENESNLEKIIKKSPKVTNTLIKLLTTQEKKSKKSVDQLREVVSDIRCIAYKPTTFRVVIPNGSFFDLKYNPSPLELNYPEDFKDSDFFQVIANGKKYDIVNRSEYEQALDQINILLKNKPITKEPEPEGGEGEAPPEGGDETKELDTGEAPPEGEEAPPEEEPKEPEK